MAQHKWHKEIKAWADGQQVQFRVIGQDYWYDFNDDDVFVSVFDNGAKEFRIKPQPKEPQYLYVYGNENGVKISKSKASAYYSLDVECRREYPYIGKIKLEQDDETN